MTNRFVGTVLALLLFACGGAVEEESEDALMDPESDSSGLGTASQQWVSYTTSSGTRWGTQATPNGGRCYASQATTADCRFVTMGGDFAPQYSVSVDTSFSSASRTQMLNLIGGIANGTSFVQGFNQQTGFPCVGCTIPVPSLSANATVGSNSRIHVVPATLPQDGSLAMRNFVQTTFANCTGNLSELPSDMRGTWRACDNAFIWVDLAAIDAVTSVAQYSQALDQTLTHGIFMAIGLGTQSIASSFRSNLLHLSYGFSQRLTSSELCLVKQFVDYAGDGINPGPFFKGSFVGC